MAPGEVDQEALVEVQEDSIEVLMEDSMVWDLMDHVGEGEVLED